MTDVTCLPDRVVLDAQLADARTARARLDSVIAWLEQGLALHASPAPTIAAPPAPPASPPRMSETPSVSAVAPAPRRGDVRDIDAKVLSTVLNANQPIAKRHIVERTGLTQHQVDASIKRLVADGKVLATGVTTTRRYQPGDRPPPSAAGARHEAGRVRNAVKLTDAVSRVGLRDRVMKAVSADPSALNRDRLAVALNADPEDIAEACTALVEKGRLRVDGDGMYLRGVPKAARVSAAA